MSEIREKLLGSKALRSRAIKVITLSIILVTAFAFSTAIISLIFDSQRNTPSSSLDDADYEPTILIPIPFPWDPLDFLDFLMDLGLDLDPEDLDALMDMFDGIPEGLDLSDYASLLAAALFSEVEVFRVYNYSNINDMEDYLWKYECFDEYSGGSWETSTTPDNYYFSTYSDYYSQPDRTEIYTIKLLSNMTPSVGEQNRFSAPSLFPIPFIMENSVSAPFIIPSSTVLRKQPGAVSGINDGLNSSAIIAEFSSSTGTNVSYDLFGLDLPSGTDINSSAINPLAVLSPSAEYTNLKNHYIDIFNGGPIANFISTYSDFAYHYNYLKNNVINEATDNAFIIADKIRNYLQYNFNLNYSSAPDTDDPINYFCQVQEGLYSDFASAFCAFARAFGVASRFVDGFNSRLIEEFVDDVEIDDCFAVKYRNMYNWAEIYVPTDASGNGYWVQMDVYFDNFMGNPPIFGNATGDFSITVTTNGTSPPYYLANRVDQVNITATLTNNTIPVENATITFSDYTSGDTLGYDDTNSFGQASIIVDITNGDVAGPHVITAQYTPQIANMGYYIVDEPFDVNLTSVTPQVINVSQPNNDTIRVQGYVGDPLNGDPIKYTNINFVLFRGGTNISVSNAFDPAAITTDENGYFDEYLEASPSILSGNYEIRADSDGTWNYSLPYMGTTFNFTIPIFGKAPVNDTSQRWNLTIDRGVVKKLYFRINGVPSDNRYMPSVSRGAPLLLQVWVLNETGQPIQGENVEFFNHTGGDVSIGNDTTDISGMASINVIPGTDSISGPNLLYAKLGSVENYSYYILNEAPTITIVSGPTPLVINKTNFEVFNIVGFLNDSTNSKPLANCDITLRIFRGGIDYTSNLTGSAPTFQTDSNGMFDETFGVDISIPPGNYTLRLEFNGSYDLTGNPYPGNNTFLLQYINTATWFSHQLQVTYLAPLILNFWINGVPSGQGPLAAITRNGAINLTAQLLLGSTPLSGYRVDFSDITNNTHMGYNFTDTSGYATYIYNTNLNTVAGPHIVYANYSSRFNYSLYVLNAPINVTLDICPSPLVINNSDTIGRSFYILGNLIDGTNGAAIQNGTVEIILDDNPLFDNNLIPFPRFQQHDNYFDCNETGEIYTLFQLTNYFPPGNYSLRVDFNGTFNYYYMPSPLILSSFSNFSYSAMGLYNLTVEDPTDISIIFKVENVHRPTTYPSNNWPGIYKSGENANFEVWIKYQGLNVTDGTVNLIDVYNTSNVIDSYTYVGGEGGYCQFLINTANLHAGLHYIEVSYSLKSNYTYIIINETISSISIVQPDFDIQRDTSGFTISGTVQDTISLKGLKVKILLLNKSNMADVSGYLQLAGSQIITINDDGTYSFTVNRIALGCPRGEYYIVINFNGSIYHVDDLLSIDMTNAMVGINSSSLNMNVTAGINIIQGYYFTEDQLSPYEYCIVNDTLHVLGNITWDDGSPIVNVQVTLFVRLTLDDSVIAVNYTATTDFMGRFDATLVVDETWPDYFSDTKIIIEFSSASNNLKYTIDPSHEQYAT